MKIMVVTQRELRPTGQFNLLKRLFSSPAVRKGFRDVRHTNLVA
jgi:hypothetical protein